MKNLRILASLLTTILFLGSTALPQTADSKNNSAQADPVAVARCQYTPADDACAGVSDATQVRRSANSETTLAQMPRRMPRPPFRAGYPPMGGPGYPRMWQSRPSPAHALIGVVIGGVVGWAVAARGNAGARATLALATVGAGIGAGIGFSIPSFPSRGPYRRRWPDGDDEDASRRKPAKPGQIRPSPPQQTASADPAPSKPVAHTAEPALAP